MPTVLSVLAHPDDAEFVCAGTLMRLRDEHGFDVHVATMTAGDCGSAVHPPAEIAAIRRAEGERAAALIGARFHCLGRLDLRVFLDDATVIEAVKLLLEVRPDVILTHAPDDYHTDHEQTSRVVRAASFAAPIPNYVGALGEPLAHIPHVYYCDPVEGKDLFGRPADPAFRIDISRQIDRKAEMLVLHASQRDWLLKHHGMDEYVAAMKAFSAQRGREAGVEYAEGYRQHLGHSYPQNNLLGELLGVA